MRFISSFFFLVPVLAEKVPFAKYKTIVLYFINYWTLELNFTTNF